MAVSQNEIELAKRNVFSKYSKISDYKGDEKQKKKYVKEHGTEEEYQLLFGKANKVNENYIKAAAKAQQAKDNTALKNRNERIKNQNKIADNFVKNGDADAFHELLEQNTVEATISKFALNEKPEPYKYDNLNTEKKKINSELYREYGNNFFELTTYDGNPSDDTHPVKMYSYAGVLKEIPSFSMSTTWEKGPASTISDTVKGFMCSPMMELGVTLGGHDRSWMNLDEGTDRTYASTSRPSFNLNFKIYTTDTIGSTKLTSWKTWLKALSIFATPSIDTKTNIYEMGSNVLGAAGGVLNKAKDLFDSAKKTFAEDTDKSTIENFVGKIETVVNQAGTVIAKRDSPKRVESTANSLNYYGAKLWYLRIMPFIFKNPLIVYISNWGVTYSKEMNNTNPLNPEPIWVEFKITCEMDQIASAPIWKYYLQN